MTKQDIDVVLLTLDALSLALTDHRHQWTPRQRRLYEQSTRILSDAVLVPKDRDPTSSRCRKPDVVSPSPRRRDSYLLDEMILAIAKQGGKVVNGNIEWTPLPGGIGKARSHAPDCAIALNGRHECSCMPNGGARKRRLNTTHQARVLPSPECSCSAGFDPECKWEGHNHA